MDFNDEDQDPRDDMHMQHSEAYCEGFEAYVTGAACPYHNDTADYHDWVCGFNARHR